MKYLYLILFLFVSVQGFAQEGSSSGKRLHLTIGAMLRSPELIDKHKVSVGHSVMSGVRKGGNIGFVYLIKPRLEIGYNLNLRYDMLYYEGGSYDQPTREFTTDHNVMASYSISNEESKVGIALGLGHSWINNNKAVTMQVSNGATFSHEIDYSTIDMIASFSYKRFHLEPKLMLNYSENFSFDLGQKDPRLWVNLRVYYSLGLF